MKISFAAVARIWRKWNLQSWRVETFKFSTDPVRGPAHQPTALLGDPPRCTVVSDSWCFGVSPTQLGSWAGRWKRVMSPISATNNAARIGPTPGVCWIAW